MDPAVGVFDKVFPAIVIVPFIVLLMCLYTISGGIRIEGDLPAHSLTNTVFLAIGAVLASFIGTTGAAMVLIRPLLETNRERKHVAHTVIIFTFIVCNCGGCLLPLGDPPLFLGYLQGVPFLWTLALWKEWLFVNGALLAIYFVWDHFFIYPREASRDVARDEARVHRLRFAGWQLNGLLLLGVILAIAFLDPSKTFPGTDWHPWLYLREVVQLALLAASLLLGSSIIGFFAALLSYFLCYWLVVKFRRKNEAMAEMTEEMEDVGEDIEL
jgi:Na+/H+ antiporter NhaD/arsenite permease-like protein